MKMKNKTKKKLAKKPLNKKMKAKIKVSIKTFNMFFLLDEFKTHRRILFAFGKAVKYTLWASFGLFCYHMYILKKKEKPE